MYRVACAVFFKKAWTSSVFGGQVHSCFWLHAAASLAITITHQTLSKNKKHALFTLYTLNVQNRLNTAVRSTNTDAQQKTRQANSKDNHCHLLGCLLTGLSNAGTTLFHSTDRSAQES